MSSICDSAKAASLSKRRRRIPSKGTGPSKDTKDVRSKDNEPSKGTAPWAPIGPSKDAKGISSRDNGPATDTKDVQSKYSGTSTIAKDVSLIDYATKAGQANSSKLQLSGQAAWAESIFNAHAPYYDMARYRVRKAQDILVLSALPRGATVLDLGCGTGHFTYLAANKAGPDGLVIGVDISGAMLQRARDKNPAFPRGRLKNVVFFQDDITTLHTAPWMQMVMKQRGAFDLIAGVSCLYLLDAPHKAIKDWAGLLKPGGRMILDQHTEEHRTLSEIWRIDLLNALGRPLPSHGILTPDMHSLERLFDRAGLKTEKSVRTKLYREQPCDRDADEVFEDNFERDAPEFQQFDKEHVRQTWHQIWRKHRDKNGQLWERIQSYITIGVKR